MTTLRIDADGAGSVIRTARKAHRCDEWLGCPGGGIKPGERYRESVCAPRHEAADGRWMRHRLCLPCAERYVWSSVRAAGGAG